MSISDDDFAAIAQSIADGPAKEAPAIGLARVKSEGGALPFSPLLMIDLIINNPSWSAKELGQAFGRSAGWISQVMATKGFQELLEPRRGEILNPEFSMTLDERFTALSIRAVSVLQEKLEQGKALPDATVLRVAELGIKALGMGQKKKEEEESEKAPLQNTSEAVAEKIMAAMAKRKAASEAIDVDAVEVKSGE